MWGFPIVVSVSFHFLDFPLEIRTSWSSRTLRPPHQAPPSVGVFRWGTAVSQMPTLTWASHRCTATSRWSWDQTDRPADGSCLKSVDLFGFCASLGISPEMYPRSENPSTANTKRRKRDRTIEKDNDNVTVWRRFWTRRFREMVPLLGHTSLDLWPTFLRGDYFEAFNTSSRQEIMMKCVFLRCASCLGICQRIELEFNLMIAFMSVTRLDTEPMHPKELWAW